MMKILIIVLIILLGFLQYSLWFSSNGALNVVRLKQHIERQEVRNERLKKRNHFLMKRISNLKEDPVFVEAIARERLGMIKRGETFYRFTE